MALHNYTLDMAAFVMFCGWYASGHVACWTCNDASYQC